MELLRKRRFARSVVGLLFVLAVVGSLTVAGYLLSDDEKNCGVERWAVKTGTDDDVWWVDLQDIWPTSIDEMRSWPKPTTLPPYNRIDSYEFYVFSMDCTLWRPGQPQGRAGKRLYQGGATTAHAVAVDVQELHGIVGFDSTSFLPL